MKKLRLTFLFSILFFAARAYMQEPIPSVFWGWSYGQPGGVTSEGGTGNCFQETRARHYIMWIGGEETTQYRYVDCNNGHPLSDWGSSLMGIE